MTMSPLSPPGNKPEASETLCLLKSMIEEQIKDAKWNLAHAEKNYRRAQKELDALNRTYESFQAVEQEGRYE